MKSFTLAIHLLKIDGFTPKPFHNIHSDPTGLKLLTRLRIGLRYPNEHKFNQFQRLCESFMLLYVVWSFFLLCHYHIDNRKTLFFMKYSQLMRIF